MLVLGACCLACLLAPGSVAAQALIQDPGFVDFDRLGVDPAEATLEINLEGALIRLVAEAMRGEDGGFAELLSGIKAIRVLSFSWEEEASQPGGAATSSARRSKVRSILERAGTAARELSDDGWRPVFRVREGGDHIDLYLREVGDAIAGVWVVVAEDGESVTMVNIVGHLDPAQLGRLGSSLRIDPLEALGRMAQPEPEKAP
jgi:hypothetical protein